MLTIMGILFFVYWIHFFNGEENSLEEVTKVWAVSIIFLVLVLSHSSYSYNVIEITTV